MASVIASRYAQALFELAKQEDLLDVCKEDLQTVAAGMIQYPELFALLKHPRINKKERKDILMKSFAGGQTYVMNFLKLLIDRNRFASIKDIEKRYQELYNEEKGIEIAYIQTAKPLDEAEEQQIVDMLKAKLKKDIIPKVKVEPELIAGLRIQVAGDVLDNSARNRLQRLKEQAKNS
ncbi:hypothetical protein A4S06_10425 [Erysipelotrichaceae bacterium MTC7]|nr:hypothetical protein A4S06_10425 [Erysipelotrichaceae bacterium MTC7]